MRARAIAARRRVRRSRPNPVTAGIASAPSARGCSTCVSSRSYLLATTSTRSGGTGSRGIGGAGPAVGSVSHRTRSASPALPSVRRIPSRSTRPSASRRPAVSLTTPGRPSRSSLTSITSRVVPGSSDTMATSRRASAFSRLDLPTFGGPASTTRNPSRTSSPRWPSSRCAAISHCRARAAPRAFSTASRATSASSEKSMAASIKASASISRWRQP